MENQKLLQEIRSLIAKDEMEAAIALLSEQSANEKLQDYLLLQSSRYTSLRKDYQNGNIAYEELQKLLNQIRTSLIEAAKQQFGKEPSLLETVEEKERTLKTDYQLAQARTAILTILKNLVQAETIGKIYQLSNIKQRKLVIQVLYELEEIGYIEKTKVNKTVYWQLSKKGMVFAKKLN